MKITTLTGWAAGIMLMVVCSGCGGTGTLVPRGQSPDLQTVYENQNNKQQQTVQPVNHRRHSQFEHSKLEHMKSEFRGGAYNRHNNTEQTWHSEPNVYPRHNQYQGGQGYSDCPDCRRGNCQRRGCRLRIHHHHTYDVKRIQNSVYPQQGQPGGAVVYPYYTHKGPSDFFYQGD